MVFFIIRIVEYSIRPSILEYQSSDLTPTGQLSLQWTFDVRTEVKVLLTKADENEAELNRFFLFCLRKENLRFLFSPEVWPGVSRKYKKKMLSRPNKYEPGQHAHTISFCPVLAVHSSRWVFLLNDKNGRICYRKNRMQLWNRSLFTDVWQIDPRSNILRPIDLTIGFSREYKRPGFFLLKRITGQMFWIFFLSQR